MPPDDPPEPLMEHDLDAHLAAAVAAVAAASDLAALKDVDGELLGKRSVVTAAKKLLRSVRFIMMGGREAVLAY